MHPLIEQHRNRIAQLCRQFQIGRLDVFGSVLRDDFRNGSDIDVVAEFSAPPGGDSVRQYFDFKESLEELFGRPVDVIELDAMENTRLKRLIEKERVTVYAAQG